MRHRTKLMLTGLVAAVALATAVGTASANRLSIDEPRFRIVWTSLTFSSEGVNPIRCPVTLEGSFHSRTIVKTRGALIGHISRASVRAVSCTNGTATILQETLPWHVTYESFSTTLPLITGIEVLLLGASFRIDPAGILPACLSRTEVGENVSGTVNLTGAGTTRKATTLRPDATDEILCRSAFGSLTGHFEGDGTVTRLGSTAQILVLLI